MSHDRQATALTVFSLKPLKRLQPFLIGECHLAEARC
jgi:hypothetical protein